MELYFLDPLPGRDRVMQEATKGAQQPLLSLRAEMALGRITSVFVYFSPDSEATESIAKNIGSGCEGGC